MATTNRPGNQRRNNNQQNNFSLGDYKEVADRLREFHAAHPDGYLTSRVIHWPTKDLPFIAVEARAYRSPEDTTPAIGMAWEPFPGLTPYTRNSELQNAETSAWGRALVAGGYADTKHGIASAEEVRNRKAEPPTIGHVAAKTRLLKAANGNKELAIELWGNRGERSIPEPELDELVAAAIEAVSQAPADEQTGEVTA